jgi:hypothetical protein
MQLAIVAAGLKVPIEPNTRKNGNLITYNLMKIAG